jgi:hypothetical protein
MPVEGVFSIYNHQSTIYNFESESKPVEGVFSIYNHQSTIYNLKSA